MKDIKIRLQKHLSACGIASRRKAEELIASGKVRVNGKIAVIGDKVDPKRDKISVRGKTVVSNDSKCYIMLNKPRGFITAMSDDRGRKTIADLTADVGVKVFPVGRLDRDSEGLLIMTNDGDITNILTHPSNHVNKTYRVTVKGEVSEDKLKKLCEGVIIEGRKTLPCDVFVVERKEDRTVLNFIIHEGRNRQIRKMCAAVGLEVLRLKRIEIAGIKLGKLPAGSWRPLNQKELNRLENISKSKEETE